MAEALTLWQQPKAKHINMIAGWRQWADAGSASSGLPQYIIEQLGAQKIGEIRPDGFYLFQIPGTHDLVRPMVQFDEGFPESLEQWRNELYYAGDEERGLVIFVGDEPHLDIERYVNTVLDAAEMLNVKRIVGLGGVYGELPYDKARTIGCVYSLRHMKAEMQTLGVQLSNYQGGASIGSYFCKRAGDRGQEFVAFYVFVPNYDFSLLGQRGSAIRIENDFMAWHAIVRRINHMLKTRIPLEDLENLSGELMRAVSSKVDELDSAEPELGVRDYLRRLSDSFEEVPFDPLDDVWEDALRSLLNDDDEEAGED
ncbi:MAG: PAC2 family protein [Chloroflexota bacterium]|nr:MAG: hypothetical protein DIU68_15735 [Chloroflexota bacterium]